MTLRCHRFIAFGFLLALGLPAFCADAAPRAAVSKKPVNDSGRFTLGLLAYPHLTEQADRLPPKRSWITRNLKGVPQVIETLNAQRPALVAVTGNLTWFGDGADHATAKRLLGALKPPVLYAAGTADAGEDGSGAAEFEKAFGRPMWYSHDHAGARLVVAGAPPKDKTDAFLDWLEADLAKAADAEQVVVLASWSALAVRDDEAAKRLAALLKKNKVTAWLGGSRYGPRVARLDGVPVVTPPAAGWSGGLSHMLIDVQPAGLKLNLCARGTDLRHTLFLPNPRRGKVGAPDGPRYLAAYREAAAARPLVTFVQISDSQIDDGTVKASARRYRYAPEDNARAFKQINALDPAPAFVVSTGDLTNKSTTAEWKTYTDLIATLKPKVYNLPGNHDLDRGTDGGTVGTLAAYERRTGDKPRHAWEAGGVAFIGLNTATTELDADQLAWLKKELDASRARPAVFVFGHHPLDERAGGTVTTGREEAIRLLDEANVTAYLCGHRHRWAFSRLNGFLHYICNDLAWHSDIGFLVCHVWADRVLLRYKPVDEDVFWNLEWPNPRSD